MTPVQKRSTCAPVKISCVPSKSTRASVKNTDFVVKKGGVPRKSAFATKDNSKLYAKSAHSAQECSMLDPALRIKIRVLEKELAQLYKKSVVAELIEDVNSEQMHNFEPKRYLFRQLPNNNNSHGNTLSVIVLYNQVLKLQAILSAKVKTNLQFNEIKRLTLLIESDLTKTICTNTKIFDSLSLEEAKLNLEIELFENRLLQEKNPSLVSDNVHHRSIKSGMPNLPIEIQQYLDFVAKFGKSGTLDDALHTSFVHLWDQHNRLSSVASEEKFINSCAVSLGLSAKEVIQHVNWYTKYTNLLLGYKTAIISWKKVKRENSSQKENKKPVEIKNVPTLDEKEKSDAKLAFERLKKKQDLKEWKERQASLQKELDSLEREKELESRAKMEEKRKKNAETKALLDIQKEALRIQEETQKMFKKSEEERADAEKRASHRIEFEKLMQREEAHVQRLQMQRKEKKAKQDELIAQQNKLKEMFTVSVPASKERLYALTKGLENRMKSLDSTVIDESIRQQFNATTYQPRMIPDWRRDP